MRIGAFEDAVGHGPSFAQRLAALQDELDEARESVAEADARVAAIGAERDAEVEAARVAKAARDLAQRHRDEAEQAKQDASERLRAAEGRIRELTERLKAFQPVAVEPCRMQMAMLSADDEVMPEGCVRLSYRPVRGSDLVSVPVPVLVAELLVAYQTAWHLDRRGLSRDEEREALRVRSEQTTALLPQVQAGLEATKLSKKTAKRLLASARSNTLLHDSR